MAIVRRLYSTPPPAQTAVQDNPTLLVSWWCTGFALVIILVRLSGRYIRTEKLFREDKIMALSIIPLMIRMGLVHVILRYGTNNALTVGLTALEIQHREIGSRLVLASRIMYAMFLWTAKFTICEFLKKLTEQVWRRSYEIGLQMIRWFLIVTFCGVVIATLAECHPFNHYWQVIPDPGAHCRQGYAQLIAMGATDVITDIVLVAFPIPIVLASNMPVKRKISLVLLFALSLTLVAITIYRVAATIERHSDQVFRSLLASLEILAAAAVSNALVLGSFVRDRGVKKQRFKFGSTAGTSSLDRPSVGRQRTHTALSWGSDADLVGDLGIRLGPDLSIDKSPLPRPAPIAIPPASQAHLTPDPQTWAFRSRESGDTDGSDIKIDDFDAKHPPDPEDMTIITPRRVSFFDLGGLLESEPAQVSPRRQNPSSRIPPPPAAYTTQDFASPRSGRRGSDVLMQDLGGLVSTPDRAASPTSRAPAARNYSRPSPSPPSQPSSPQPASAAAQPRQHREQQLQDVGGLLS